MPAVSLKTLAPLHIGDGQEYTNFSYFPHQGRLYFVDSNAFRKLEKAQREKLLSILSAPKGHSLDTFLNHFPELRQSMSETAQYWLTLPDQKQFNANIFTFIKTGNKVYIPGSEIKGAIRTAILYNLLNRDPLNATLKKLLQQFPKGFTGKTKVKQLEQLEDKIQALALCPKEKADAKFDLLKLLHIADSEAKEPSSVLELVQVHAVTRRGRGPSQWCEVAKSGNEFRSEMEIASDPLTREFLHRFAFESSQKQLGIQYVLRAAHEFYLKVLDEEISFFESFSNTAVRAVTTELQEIKKKSTPESPVIRLGKHQGFLSLTLAILLREIREKHPGFYNNHILPLVTRRSSRYSSFPASRKLVQLGGRYSTLGWVQLSGIN